MDKELELRVKEYNNNYKKASEEYNKAKAQISVYENEIDSLCAELTSSLGIEVTKENALAIYQRKEKEIRQQLEVGESIINRINNEASIASNQNDLNTVQGVVADFKLPQNDSIKNTEVKSDSEFLGEADFGVDLDGSEVSTFDDNFINKPTSDKQDMGAFNGFFNNSVDDI